VTIPNVDLKTFGIKLGIIPKMPHFHWYTHSHRPLYVSGFPGENLV